MANLFQTLKRGGKVFGNLAGKYDGLTDVQLIKLYQGGDADALVEYGNRHSGDLTYRARHRGFGDNNAVNENIGQVWLDMERAARSMDTENAKVTPQTYVNRQIDWSNPNTEYHNKNVREAELQESAIPSNESIENGNTAMEQMSAGMSKKFFDLEQRERELSDALEKLKKQLDPQGNQILDAYKAEDYRVAKDMENNFKVNNDGSTTSRQLTDANVARELGESPQTFRNHKNSMLDRLNPKLKQEILELLRNRKEK